MLNYHKRGIREKAKQCEVDLVRITNDLTIQINSKEQIKVFYADASEKIVRQSYCYTCEKRDGAWVITAMEDNAKPALPNNKIFADESKDFACQIGQNQLFLYRKRASCD